MQRVDRDGVGDDDAGEVGLGEPLERVAAKIPCVAKTQTSFAPCSFSASAPARSVPPVMITSSPTSAILSRTRPVISVTAATSCAGRVLFMIAKSASSISREAHRHLRPARIGRHRDDPVAVEAEVAEVAGEERQRGHVVDGDREEALDLPRVQVHGQDAVGAGELEHVGDEPPGDRLARAAPCGPGASRGTTGSTAVIRFAEPSFAAWIISSSSIRLRSTGSQPVWTRKTSAPRIDSR